MCGVLAMVTSIVIGVMVGMIAGYFGGLVDSILMRIVDVFSAIPWIIMVTVVSLLFKKGIASIIIVIGHSSNSSSNNGNDLIAYTVFNFPRSHSNYQMWIDAEDSLEVW